MKRIQVKHPRGLAFLFKSRRIQRTRIQEELVWLSIFLEEWFWQNHDMKEANQYQEPEYILKRWEKLLQQVLGGPGYGDGILQDILNQRMGNLLVRLKADIPFIPETDYFAYSYFVAGFENHMVAHLLGFPSAKIVSAIKSRLKDQFLQIHSPYKFEYLELLRPQKLPNCQRNAIFAR